MSNIDRSASGRLDYFKKRVLASFHAANPGKEEKKGLSQNTLLAYKAGQIVTFLGNGLQTFDAAVGNFLDGSDIKVSWTVKNDSAYIKYDLVLSYPNDINVPAFVPEKVTLGGDRTSYIFSPDSGNYTVTLTPYYTDTIKDTTNYVKSGLIVP